jgi:hypothetical protein
MKFIPIGMLGLLLAACTAPPTTRAPSAPGRPADFPAAFYRAAIAAGGAVYRVDPTRSLGTVYTYRGGSLRKLGHDHVIASHEIQGYCLAGKDTKDSRADLYVPLASLAIDEPALRRSAGFEGELRPDEIAATRVHMLESVLQAERYPFAQIRAAWAKERRDKVLNVEIRLHGVARSYRVPVRYSRNSNSLTVSGQLCLRTAADPANRFRYDALQRARRGTQGEGRASTAVFCHGNPDWYWSPLITIPVWCWQGERQAVNASPDLQASAWREVTRRFQAELGASSDDRAT